MTHGHDRVHVCESLSGQCHESAHGVVCGPQAPGPRGCTLGNISAMKLDRGALRKSISYKKGMGTGHGISQARRRGKCLLEMGRLDAAAQWVKQGLEFEATEQDLVNLKDEIERKQRGES